MIVSCLILAAGQASRMGEPKQLLPFGEGTLLQHVIRIATGASFQEIRVVLGAHKDRILPILDGHQVRTSYNPVWKTGMGSSISKGVSELSKEAEGVVIMLGDQPFILSSHLGELIQKHQESQQPIVASFYEEKLGVPAFFHRSKFPQLLSLKEKQGAGKLIKSSSKELAYVEFPHAAIDLDTKEDYNKWRSLGL